MNRRQFLKGMGIVGTSLLLPTSGSLFASTQKKKVLVLGIDGMDIGLTRQYMKMGFLPNVRRLAHKGCMTDIRSSTPPQSPVAWSNVITGAPPEVHGIYDFIHRNPENMMPYLSTSTVHPSKRILHIGNYNIPLSAGETELLRSGTAFWDVLAKHDIPTTIFKMPANFPCKSKKVKMVSGMGTPDLRGGYGNYTIVTSVPEKYGKNLTGGIVIPVQFNRGRADIRLPGPENSLKKGAPESSIPITVWRDKDNSVIRIRLQGNELILKPGELSAWQEIAFPMLGDFFNVKGICKLFVHSVHPDFSLYISPINIHPADPSLPVVTPEGYGKELVENVGLFYTQGFPEDTKALSEGSLSEDEYLILAEQVFTERQSLLEYEIKRFSRLDEGMLFFYFSSLDQNSHMFWRTLDKTSPLYQPDQAEKYGNTILNFYRQVDDVLGSVMETIDIADPKTTLMVMSDHGFGAFNRQANLNTWLFKKGYLALNTGFRNVSDGQGYFKEVNWSKTGVYNVGINCLYLNREDREINGVVTNGQADGLLNRLSNDLKEMRDPETGGYAVASTRIIGQEEHRRHPYAPDIIVGWNDGFRNSWKSILGAFEPDVFKDNLDKWSGDHCIDPVFVPAILISNKKLEKKYPDLCDIAPTILRQFGLNPAVPMTGKSLFSV